MNLENNHCIYMHENKINHKKYIGQCKGNPNIRWRTNGKGYYNYNQDDKHQSHFYNAIQKYGWDNFDHIILKDNLSLEEANYWEEYYIEYYHTWKKDPQCWGYNEQKGGNNHQVSDEIGQKISETLKSLHLTHTEEWKKERSEAMKGENNPFYGKKHSEETRKKMSENHANVWGGNSSSAKKVRCIETGEIFPSSREASEFVHRTKSAINNCIYGLSNTCGGYHWERVEE